jgi:hypothetical protein
MKKFNLISVKEKGMVDFKNYLIGAEYYYLLKGTGVDGKAVYVVDKKKEGNRGLGYSHKYYEIAEAEALRMLKKEQLS